MNKILSIKFFLTLLILFFGLFAFTQSSQAADYYVSFSDGSDSNPGTQSQPIKYHPWMGEFTGSVTLQPGDTVYMKRGDLWTSANPVNQNGFIEVESSGNEGCLITTTAYGSGNRPSIRISDENTEKSIIYAYNKGYLKFDGLDIKHSVNTYDTDFMKSGIQLYRDCHHIYITNNEISNVGYGVVGWPNIYELHIGDESAATTATPYSYSNYIHDVAYAGISVTGRGSDPAVTNAYVYYNYIRDIGLGVACGGVNNGNAYGIAFSANWEQSRGWPVNAYARYNRIENVPTWECMDTHGCINCHFENNYARNCQSHAALFSDYRLPYPDKPKFYFFRNNTLVQPQVSSCVPETGASSSIKFVFLSGVNDDGTPAVDSEISGNTIYYEGRPGAQYDGMIKLATANGGTTIIENNKIYNSPISSIDSAIFLGYSYGQSYDATVHVRNNEIFNSSVGMILRGDFANSPTTNVYVYNNLIYDTDSPIKLANNNLAYKAHFYNNHLLGNGNNRLISFDSYGLASGAFLGIKNNIFQFSSSSNQQYFFSSGPNNGNMDIDNNMYFNSVSTMPFDSPGSVAKNWSDWKNLGYDTHGLNGVDPLFANMISHDFHLTGNSPAIDKGADFSGIFQTDFDNSNRPQGTGFDIGAYEYVSGEDDTTPPVAPTGLAVQ